MQRMRQIVLDTETTGLKPEDGHRIIEIACVELVNRRPSGRHVHFYFNPERSCDPGAFKVHGLSDEFLADKPLFAEVADDIEQFCRGAEVIIHNAPFDVGFLEHEYQRLQRPGLVAWAQTITDTLVLSKQLNPGKRHNLDALCERYGVNNAHRSLHGALLDAQLLAEVYLAMTRGQNSLMMELAAGDSDGAQEFDIQALNLVVLRADDEELTAHEQYLDRLEKEIKRPPLWRTLEPSGE
jgi:DNA polymerase-3 subunit epsilon